jgi:DNA (cytosine-5)-methyltransferase 1
MDDKTLKVCSLFSGCGGLDLGFEQAKHPTMKFKTIWANDYEKPACDTYMKNFPHTEVVCGDIWEYDLTKLPACDVIIGGFPCQDFSVLSKRKGLETERGLLYTRFVEAVSLKKPTLFVAENVKGLLSANDGFAIKRIIDDFGKLGYHIHYKLIKFADYGVPQKRERVIIVGIRKDLDGTFHWPERTHTNKHVSSKKALENVEKVKHNNETQNHPQKTIDMLNAIPPGGNFRDLPPELAVKGLMSGIYRRLHPDKPSPTVIANGGGGTWGYHYDKPRSLTNRERARLQTFPDSFVFEGNISQVRKQIGNAVPPMGAKIIAEAILKNLADKEL